MSKLFFFFLAHVLKARKKLTAAQFLIDSDISTWVSCLLTRNSYGKFAMFSEKYYHFIPPIFTIFHNSGTTFF